LKWESVLAGADAKEREKLYREFTAEDGIFKEGGIYFETAKEREYEAKEEAYRRALGEYQSASLAYQYFAMSEDERPGEKELNAMRMAKQERLNRLQNQYDAMIGTATLTEAGEWLEAVENAYISLLPQPQPTTTQATPVQHVADDLPKDEIGKKIALAIAKALEEDKLSTEDYGELREALLATFPSLKTKGEIADYLQELAIDYPFFIPLLQEFHITQREERQSATISQAENLIRENKITEALSMMSPSSTQIT